MSSDARTCCGVRPPNVVVFHTSGDATKSGAIKLAMQRAAATMPGARTSSFFSTGNSMYVSADRHTIFEEVYPAGIAKFEVSGEEVSVEVGEKGMSDSESEFLGVDQVLVDVALGIDDDGGTALLVSEQVGGVGQAAEIVLLEDHRRFESSIG